MSLFKFFIVFVGCEFILNNEGIYSLSFLLITGFAAVLLCLRYLNWFYYKWISTLLFPLQAPHCRASATSIDYSLCLSACFEVVSFSSWLHLFLDCFLFPFTFRSNDDSCITLEVAIFRITHTEAGNVCCLKLSISPSLSLPFSFTLSLSFSLSPFSCFLFLLFWLLVWFAVFSC